MGPLCFNPLHCGAVVASSPPRSPCGGRGRVSIPFIAGQWSLPGSQQGPRGPRPSSFNPLHCGAVVASPPGLVGSRTNSKVSIPFIAGQWSLRPDVLFSPRRTAGVSIPFIAGQWSLHPEIRWRSGCGFVCFNPLHCGAVVASPGGVRTSAKKAKFQSPSLRGSGRFPGGKPPGGDALKFQSPSLRGSGRFPPPSAEGGWGDAFQSPSLRGSGRFTGAGARKGSRHRSFNPLHCGAVVASESRLLGGRPARHVSIPFIAGQWSLRWPGRATRRTRRVSIPFIAGQWSLRGVGGVGNGTIHRFQSPSLRGSGRFAETPRVGSIAPPCFNPLHCGAVVAS